MVVGFVCEDLVLDWIFRILLSLFFCLEFGFGVFGRFVGGWYGFCVCLGIY